MDYEKQFIEAINNSLENIYYPFDILQQSDKPVFIWGGGSLSVSVRKVLEANDIMVEGYLIDNCPTKSLFGLPVLSRQEIRDTYQHVNIVIGHAKYELQQEMEKEDFASSVVCITDVCYGQWERTSAESIKVRLPEYVKLAELLTDDDSVECLKAFLACKVSGRWQDIFPVVSGDTYFDNPFFKVDGENFLDLGAYDGDTIREYLKKDKCYKNIYAFEPEEESFSKLKKYVNEEGLSNVFLYKLGGWDSKTTLFFAETEESSSISEDGTVNSIMVDRVDNVLKGKQISLIKINYYVGVSETLLGCAGIIKTNKPNIVITAGFDAFSVLQYSKILKELDANYRISLRFGAAMPARLFLYAYYPEEI